MKKQSNRRAILGTVAVLGTATLSVLSATAANADPYGRDGRGDQQYHTNQQYRGGRDNQRFNQGRHDEQLRNDRRYEAQRYDNRRYADQRYDYRRYDDRRYDGGYDYHRYDRHDDTGAIIGAGILGAVLGSVLSR